LDNRVPSDALHEGSGQVASQIAAAAKGIGIGSEIPRARMVARRHVLAVVKGTGTASSITGCTIVRSFCSASRNHTLRTSTGGWKMMRQTTRSNLLVRPPKLQGRGCKRADCGRRRRVELLGRVDALSDPFPNVATSEEGVQSCARQGHGCHRHDCLNLDPAMGDPS
jgi:hypothetical protein